MTTLGGPGGGSKFSKPIPPERGSFPLDHEAECQPIMKEYLRCLRSHRGVNDEVCRQLSKNYLQCRMERNLMAPDTMKNLGYHDPASEAQANALKAKVKEANSGSTSSGSTSQNSDQTRSGTSEEKR